MRQRYAVACGLVSFFLVFALAASDAISVNTDNMKTHDGGRTDYSGGDAAIASKNYSISAGIQYNF